MPVGAVGVAGTGGSDSRVWWCLGHRDEFSRLQRAGTAVTVVEVGTIAATGLPRPSTPRLLSPKAHTRYSHPQPPPPAGAGADGVRVRTSVAKAAQPKSTTRPGRKPTWQPRRSVCAFTHGGYVPFITGVSAAARVFASVYGSEREEVGKQKQVGMSWWMRARVRSDARVCERASERASAARVNRLRRRD